MSPTERDPVPEENYPTPAKPLSPWAALVALPVTVARKVFDVAAHVGKRLRRE